MPIINILDVATANRIAAGEVVERPASIVKELVENSLDAGATAVTVETREGGVGYLRITDNGAGFPHNEVRVAFERHATSKLASGDPLDRIGTLGFRGEALPSIASVARVELTTRQKGQSSGVRLMVEGGVFGELREVGCPEGTTMVVRDLFFNTPARRAFLKKETTEAGHVGDAVLQLSLSREDVAFRLITNGRTNFHTPGDGDLLKTIQMLYGREISNDLIEIDSAFPGGSLRGYIGLQDAARANRQRESFFVNGRAVRSPLLATALEEAVKGSIAIGRYPFCVLKLITPLDKVDVNVHPNKLEVRFRDEADIRAAVFAAVSDALKPRSVGMRVPLLPGSSTEMGKTVERIEPTHMPTAPAVPALTKPVAPPPYAERPVAPYVAAERSAMRLPRHDLETPWPEDLPAFLKDTPAKMPQGNGTEASASAKRTSAQTEPEQPHRMDRISVQTVERLPAKPIAQATEMPMTAQPRLIGTLFSTYVLIERESDFLMIDQHAAHERLLFEKLRAAMESGNAVAQPLLIPFFYDTTPGEKERILEHMADLEAMGFAVEDFGPAALRVSSVPHLLGDPQLKDFFVDLAARLDSIHAMNTAEMKRDELARIACHKAVKGGDHLDRREIETLLEMMDARDVPLTCPHGRPIVLRMTRVELEKRFRRTQ